MNETFCFRNGVFGWNHPKNCLRKSASDVLLWYLSRGKNLHRFVDGAPSYLLQVIKYISYLKVSPITPFITPLDIEFDIWEKFISSIAFPNMTSPKKMRLPWKPKDWNAKREEALKFTAPKIVSANKITFSAKVTSSCFSSRWRLQFPPKICRNGQGQRC